MADRNALAMMGQKVHLDSIRCEGHEDGILHCPSVYDEYCYQHLENAGVVCEGKSPPCSHTPLNIPGLSLRKINPLIPDQSHRGHL